MDLKKKIKTSLNLKESNEFLNRNNNISNIRIKNISAGK